MKVAKLERGRLLNVSLVSQNIEQSQNSVKTMSKQHFRFAFVRLFVTQNRFCTSIGFLNAICIWQLWSNVLFTPGNQETSVLFNIFCKEH